jgi:ABC-type polysaccharide/polyol phosphate transport system ATPase subunit
MRASAIEVEGVSKRFQLGERGAAYATVRDALASRASSKRRQKDEPTSIWALRDVTLVVGEGEVLGVIGRNGAGKSTLLKILARITEPTSGVSRTRGRVGALLEVGTGFHPELTGRENIYLNGTILGMTRREIRARLDEIVAFAGVERFLDTPLKRYSSGMYLRLAFAVAAHVEPEILLVDEVLAVGDADFQRRCLGKMEDLRQDGRTIVFVSHNLGAISRLCHRSVWLEQGAIRDQGPSEQIVEQYLGSLDGGTREGRATFAPRGGDVELLEITLADSEGSPIDAARRDRSFSVHARLIARRPVRGLDVAIYFRDRQGIQVLCEKWSDTGNRITCTDPPTEYELALTIPPSLAAGEYIVGLWIGTESEEFVYQETLPIRILPRADDYDEAIRRNRIVQPGVEWRLESDSGRPVDGPAPARLPPGDE